MSEVANKLLNIKKNYGGNKFKNNGFDQVDQQLQGYEGNR
jgi:hypothetical protein